MADYNRIKDYKQLYRKLWFEMNDKVLEMQKILTEVGEISRLIQYESPDSDFIIHKTERLRFGKDKKE